MNTLLIRLIFILRRAFLLVLRPSLPLQALALLIIRGSTAISIACNFSILLGIYTILIYARGLLVLLAYFVALSPDQTLNTPSRSTSLSSFIIIILITSLSYPFSNFSHITPHSTSFRNAITMLPSNSASLLIIIALILVLTIIAVVKVSSLRRGPVRPWSR